MSEKVLSVFIDESGNFGPYEAHSPYYFVSMILHNQNVDISENIHVFNSHLFNLGYQHNAIHTGPLIRHEANAFIRSELEFFNNIRDFEKNYLKHIRMKRL